MILLRLKQLIEKQSQKSGNVTAKYNMANMYYSKRRNQVTERYKQAASVAETKEAKHKVFHNFGNILMKQKNVKKR